MSTATACRAVLLNGLPLPTVAEPSVAIRWIFVFHTALILTSPLQGSAPPANHVPVILHVGGWPQPSPASRSWDCLWCPLQITKCHSPESIFLAAAVSSLETTSLTSSLMSLGEFKYQMAVIRFPVSVLMVLKAIVKP